MNLTLRTHHLISITNNLLLPTPLRNRQPQHNIIISQHTVYLSRPALDTIKLITCKHVGKNVCLLLQTHVKTDGGDTHIIVLLIISGTIRYWNIRWLLFMSAFLDV